MPAPLKMQRVTGLEMLLMSRTTMPDVLRRVTSASALPAGICDAQVNVAGDGGFGPPGVGLGNAGEVTAVGVGGLDGLDGEGVVCPVGPGEPPHAASTNNAAARTVPLMYSLTSASNARYGGCDQPLTGYPDPPWQKQ